MQESSDGRGIPRYHIYMTAKSTNPKYAAQDILSRRDHSEFELRQKMKKKGFFGDELEETVEWLKTKKLLNDELFAKKYIESIILTRAVGRRYLAFKLKEKRIGEEAIGAALDELLDEATERDLAQKATSSWKKSHSKHAADKTRLSRFLLSRGFSGSAMRAS